jgi:hypothetical protein
VSMTWMVYSDVPSNLGIKYFQSSLTVIGYLQHNYMNERK